MDERQLRRFFVERVPAGAGMCTLSGVEANHIRRVLRMGAGSRLMLIDGRGNRFLGRIASAGPRGVEVILEKSLPRPASPPIEIVLCQAVLKSPSMDLVVQKATELGAGRIVPFFSERTVVTLKGGQAENKLRRWRGIARMATAQSDGGRPPEIEPPVAWHDLLLGYRDEDACKAILWEEVCAPTLKPFLRALKPPERFVGIVGPEGGFSAREVEEASRAGFARLGAGRRILRAETAAITLVGVVQYEWGDLGGDAGAGGSGDRPVGEPGSDLHVKEIE